MEVMDEPILKDDYPVYASYWYIMDGEPRRSPIQGIVRDLKLEYKVREVRRCDAVKRKLPLMGLSK
jgi:hypothetical protein